MINPRTWCLTLAALCFCAGSPATGQETDDAPAGSYLSLLRDAYLCPYQSSTVTLAGVGRQTDEASQIAASGKCALVLSANAGDGTEVYYQVLVHAGRGVIVVEQTIDGIALTRLVGFALSSDFAVSSLKPAPRPIYVQVAPEAYGCPSPEAWHKILSDPNRKNQSPSSIYGFIESFGCSVEPIRPNTIWTEIGSSDNGLLLRLRSSSTEGAANWYRADAFGSVDAKPSP